MLQNITTLPAVKSNPFDSVFHLTHEVAIYIPSTVNANQDFDTSAYVTEAATLLSIANQGATITKAQGCWVSDTHGLIREDVTVISSNCDSLDCLEALYTFALKVKTDLSQEAVAVKIDSKLYFI